MCADRISYMCKRAIFLVVSVLILIGCGPNEQKQFYVGILSDAPGFPALAEGFKAGMAELGYVEGEHIVYTEKSFVAPDPDGEKEAVEGFISDKADLVFAYATGASIVAQTVLEGTEIPLVFCFAGVEGANMIESIRKPGKNTTGVRFPGPEQISKRLELLLDIAPRAKKVWVGYNINNPNNEPALTILRPLASSLGITLIEAPSSTLEQMKVDLDARAASGNPGMDAIILMPDGFNHTPQGLKIITSFASKHRVILGGSFPYTVKAGAVFGNANDLFKVGKMAAPLADKILKGMPAGTIPVLTPEDEVWINYKVAQELGLTLPEGLLSMALEIYR
jgi:putative ABC transport system substrate-binding protein